ncbi:tigger transposable element-derived 4 [Brachionus plicatilis]|uniref:Tigger transposable element-derived 4 n=1 Tax=Brachionus plicatilis TaxID=10195 RepID=A0A3M7T805_BRAPC|nr:tigger transposable element-derived 4 [Brachionus plicatilis]
MESKKRKGPEISLKLEIIVDYNNKATPTELSRKYGLAPSTISTIVKNQEAIKKASESMRDIKKAKRLREPEYKELEKYLDMWFRDTKAHNSITLDGPLIQAQALKIVTMLQKPDFKASSGWLNKYNLEDSLPESYPSGKKPSFQDAFLKLLIKKVCGKKNLSNTMQNYLIKNSDVGY